MQGFHNVSHTSPLTAGRGKRQLSKASEPNSIKGQLSLIETTLLVIENMISSCIFIVAADITRNVRFARRIMVKPRIKMEYNNTSRFQVMENYVACFLKRADSMCI